MKTQPNEPSRSWIFLQLLSARALYTPSNMVHFEADLNSRRFKPIVEADRQEGMKLGVDGTPFFFVNGRAVSGALPLADFKKIVEDEIKKLPQPLNRSGQ